MLITMNHVINTTKFRKLVFVKFIIFTLGNFETFAWVFVTWNPDIVSNISLLCIGYH